MNKNLFSLNTKNRPSSTAVGIKANGLGSKKIESPINM